MTKAKIRAMTSPIPRLRKSRPEAAIHKEKCRRDDGIFFAFRLN
jgi:hypothetical protein